MKVLRRLRRNRSAVIGALIVFVFLVLSLLADVLSPYDPIKQNLAMALKGPSPEHWMGTDSLGRDVLSRVMYGARISLVIGAGAVILSATVGVLLGTAAGYLGRHVDEVIMRVIDGMMAFPSLLLALITVAVLGPELVSTVIAVGVAAIPRFARLSRSSVLTVKELDYVEAARCLGQSDLVIVTKHILPNCLSPLIVQASLLAAEAILTASGLGFLGLGAQPPTPEWGTMLSDGRGLLRAAPHVATFPGLAILVVALAFNLLGDGLRDALDIRL